MSNNDVTHKRLGDLEAGAEAPHFLISDDKIYVQVEWICDRMGYTQRGEARTSWRKFAKFSVTHNNAQMWYIEGSVALNRLARATVYGQKSEEAKGELAVLHGQLEYVAHQNSLVLDVVVPPQYFY